MLSPAPAIGVTPGDQTGAGSDRRDADMMGPPASTMSACAPPSPTPGRDIAGEETEAGSAGSVFRRGDTRERDGYDSTDDRDARDSDSDSDHGERYTRRPGAEGDTDSQRASRIHDRSSRDRETVGHRGIGEQKTEEGERDHRY